MFGEKRIAYLFPGQGSQVVGMGSALYQESPGARAIFDQADEALGFPLSHLCFQGPEEQLRQTVNAQPAILTTSIAALQAVAEAGDATEVPRPMFVAGHSLGEYAALVAAGVLDFVGALRLVRERGRLMQEVGKGQRGGMAAILGLDKAGVAEACRRAGVVTANINCDGEVVVSGEIESVTRAMGFARELGARRAVPLPVSGAFHSCFMKPAASGLAAALDQTAFRPPAVPVVGNCTGEPLNDVAAIRDELMAQLYTCVQWSKSVEYMADNGVGTFVEIGPGAVLTGLTKRIAKDVPAFSVADVASARTFAGRFVENDGVLRAVEVSSAGATHPVGGIPARVSGQVGIADPASRSTGRIVGR